MPMRRKDVYGKRSIMGMETHEITAAAALVAISAALQLAHAGLRTPWGMWIDIVAIPWILAYFLYGARSALVVSITGALVITLFAPATWLGAIVKWSATIPMILIPALMQATGRVKVKDFRRPYLLALAILSAVLLRGAITIPMNYYYALPIWMGWTPAEAMSLIPWWVIFGINAVQGVLEVVVAWILVFRFRLDRFATWR